MTADDRIRSAVNVVKRHLEALESEKREPAGCRERMRKAVPMRHASPRYKR
jgi:hypothetical protein